MRKYIKIARLDHWIKQLFITPGIVVALLLTDVHLSDLSIVKLLLGLFGTCFIASANYVINEWLDAPFDKYHPQKKNRPVVTENMELKWVLIEYTFFSIIGLIFSCLVNKLFLVTAFALLIMGIVYNVKPIRSKDIVYFDVISESVNNMLRLLMGWFIVTSDSIPPSSIRFGYWMAGAYLMATKRFSEYRMIDNPKVAGLYRKSFEAYTEKKLLASSIFYALSSTFCLGVFLVKYRIEYVLCIPFIFLLFSYYSAMALDNDSAVQKPEKLYKEKKLMLLVLLIIILFIVCTLVDFDFLKPLSSSALLKLDV